MLAVLAIPNATLLVLTQVAVEPSDCKINPAVPIGKNVVTPGAVWYGNPPEAPPARFVAVVTVPLIPPPTNKAPLIPTPPVTCKAPDVGDVDTVLSVNLETPVALNVVAVVEPALTSPRVDLPVTLIVVAVVAPAVTSPSVLLPVTFNVLVTTKLLTVVAPAVTSPRLERPVTVKTLAVVTFNLTLL